MKNILVIEDDTAIRESLCDILEFAGYKVTSAVDGKDGLQIILAESPDLVICDINMPKLNGYNLLAALNQRLSSDEIPIFIFLTAKIELKDVRSGLNLGADDYITKPFNHNELLSVVSMRLKKRDKLTQGHVEDKNQRIKSENIISATSDLHKIALPCAEGLELIEFNRITRCEADRAYCKFYVKDRGRIVVSKPLREFEETLTHNNFVKTHKSHIINLLHVKKYVRGNSGYLIMSDDTSVPISSRRREEVVDRLKNL